LRINCSSLERIYLTIGREVLTGTFRRESEPRHDDSESISILVLSILSTYSLEIE
jgi:hypothetical protein